MSHAFPFATSTAAARGSSLAFGENLAANGFMNAQLIVAHLGDGKCWHCGKPFSSGVRVDSGGACAVCIDLMHVSHEEVAFVLPRVWGERKSRLSRTAEIIRALNARGKKAEPVARANGLRRGSS
jgi:hypothetical protein